MQTDQTGAEEFLNDSVNQRAEAIAVQKKAVNAVEQAESAARKHFEEIEEKMNEFSQHKVRNDALLFYVVVLTEL